MAMELVDMLKPGSWDSGSGKFGFSFNLMVSRELEIRGVGNGDDGETLGLEKVLCFLGVEEGIDQASYVFRLLQTYSLLCTSWL